MCVCVYVSYTHKIQALINTLLVARWVTGERFWMFMEKCSVAFWLILASLYELATEEHPTHTRERFRKWQSIPNWAEVQCIGSFIT